MTAEDMAHLNFMKKQQWNVAYYAILLLAAIFAVKKEFDPLVNAEPMLVAVTIDRFAFDVLKYEKGLACGGYTCVQQLCNVDVRKPSEDRTFTPEPFFQTASRHREV